jgi:hypothetical protein
MSVNLTWRKTWVSRACVGKTDTFRPKELGVQEKTDALPI